MTCLVLRSALRARRNVLLAAALIVSSVLPGGSALAASPGNRLAYLGAPCDPYYVGLGHARLVTPQWIGEEGVEAVVVLSIDDMRDPGVYKRFLQPILDRLAKIDGRAPVSIMTNGVAPTDPLLQELLRAGASIEAHTTNHPCPMLAKGDFVSAKAGYDAAIDLTAEIPNSRPIGFRTPCCDSKNVLSPRLFTEIFRPATPAGNFLQLDSSVFIVHTGNDPAMPRELAIDEQGRPRFAKYVPLDRKFANFVEDYPYPYVIDNFLWEIPSSTPDDWLGQNLQKPKSPAMIADMQLAIDAAVRKQGVYVLTFHPHNWIAAEQVVGLVDYTVGKYGRRVKFLNFREMLQRLTDNVLGGAPLRAADGSDNGVRVLDVDGDGYVDAVIANATTRQTRVWSPAKNRWETTGFPAAIVGRDAAGKSRPTGLQFGVLSPGGSASVLVRSEDDAGVWTFRSGRWTPEPQGLGGLDDGGPLATAAGGRDAGLRLVDLDGNGRCEALVASPTHRAAYAWQAGGGWKRLPFTSPAGALLVDAQGRDAGCRLWDVDGDGRPDWLCSTSEACWLDLFVSATDGWSKRVFRHSRSAGGDAVSAFVRADGTNNGAFFTRNTLYLQNEDTGGRLPGECEIHPAADLLRGKLAQPPAGP